MSDNTEKKQFTDLVPAPPEAELQKESVPIITGESSLKIGSDLIDQIGQEMSQAGFNNLKILCLQNEYEIAGKKYTGKKLTPKLIKEIRKIDKDADDFNSTTTDPITLEENGLAVLKSKAFIHLGMTPEEFEETDIPLLQQVVTARDLRIRGWFRLQ